MPKPTPAEILAAAQEVSPELRERIRIAIGTLEATRKPLTVRALRETSSAGTQPVSAVLKAYRAGVLPAPAQTSSWRKLGDLERVAVPGTCEEHDRNLRFEVQDLVNVLNELLLTRGCETLLMLEAHPASRTCHNPRAHKNPR